MRFVKIIVSFMLFLLVIFCTEDIKTISSGDTELPPYEKQLDVIPKNGAAGIKLKIFGMKFDRDIIYAIEFEDVEPVRPDSGCFDTLYVTTPFEAKSGFGFIKIHQRDIDTVGVVENFFYYRECDTSWLCILPSNLNYKITEYLASITNTYLYTPPDFKGWSAVKKADTVVISRYYESGEHDFEYTIKFQHLNNNDLPLLLEATHKRYGDSGTFSGFMDVGVIKIQDWDINGIISGRVLGKAWGWYNYSFWYDFTEQ